MFGEMAVEALPILHSLPNSLSIENLKLLILFMPIQETAGTKNILMVIFLIACS
jgi:hypothetical protein